MTEKQSNPDDSSGQRRPAEEIAKADEARPQETLSNEQTKQLVHELQVHQIELEMRNQELCETQGQLERSRARYFDLYDLAPVGYFTVNEEGSILEANVTGAGLLGVGTRDLINQPLTQFILPEDQDIYYRHRKQLLAAGSPRFCELRLVRKDAALFWARLDAAITRDDESGVRACRVVVSDITERKQAEQALLQERDLVSHIMETSPIGIVTTDRNGKITYANGQAERVLGLTRGQITRRFYNAPEWHVTDCEGYPFPDENLPFYRVMATGQPVENVRHAIQWPDGRRVPLSINATPLLDGAGHANGMVAVLEDITESRGPRAGNRKAEPTLRGSQRVEPDYRPRQIP